MDSYGPALLKEIKDTKYNLIWQEKSVQDSKAKIKALTAAAEALGLEIE